MAGYREDPLARFGFAPVLRKLAGEDGSVIWEKMTEVGGLMTDARGDLVASSGTLMKLDGHDGREIWRTSSAFSVVGRIARGNVLATVCTPEASDVVMLRGDDGSALWRRTLPNCRFQAAVFRDRDVVIAALVGSNVEVLRFDGRTGATRWRRIVASQERYGAQLDIVVYPSAALVRLSALTGREKFRSAAPAAESRGRFAMSSRGPVVLVDADGREDSPGFEVETVPRRLVR